MTILFLGNHTAPHSSENHHRRTLEKLGHTVIKLQERVATKDDILKYRDIDIFLWVHTHGWDTHGIGDVLKEFKRRGVVTITYHLDLWMGLERQKEMEEDYFKLDHFFTVDKLMADWLNQNTETKGHYVMAGCVEDESYMAVPDTKKYPHEIIFVGSRGYHPEYPYRKELIEWLEKTYGSNFAQYGNGGLPSIRGGELNQLYASAKIVIGDTLCKDFCYGWYFSDRLFEVVLRGGFLIFPYIVGLEDAFEIGKEIAIYPYNHFDVLKHYIDYYLKHDEEREEIRQAGFKRGIENHTYTHRWKQILAEL